MSIIDVAKEIALWPMEIYNDYSKPPPGITPTITLALGGAALYTFYVQSEAFQDTGFALVSGYLLAGAVYYAGTVILKGQTKQVDVRY